MELPDDRATVDPGANDKHVSSHNEKLLEDCGLVREDVTGTRSRAKDHGIAILLTLLAACTRFWRLDQPAAVVFDEHHFGRFVNRYMTGRFYFDIHPPLAKLTLATVAGAVGYDSETCLYEAIHQEYPPSCNYIPLRACTATLGTLLIPIVYYIARELMFPQSSSTLVALLVTFDGLNATESRFILTDAHMMFYVGASFLIAVKFWKRRNMYWYLRQISNTPKATKDISRKRTGSIQWSRMHSWFAAPGDNFMPLYEEVAWCTLLGLACGAAVSVKWTSLATPGFIAVECYVSIFILKDRLPMKLWWYTLAVAATLYTLLFAVHLHLLPFSGDGDLFMPVEFQADLIHSVHYDPHKAPESFVWAFLRLNKEMFVTNAAISTTHAWSSSIQQWIFDLKGVLYFSLQQGEEDKFSSVYLLGNVCVLWPAVVAVLLAAYGMLGSVLVEEMKHRVGQQGLHAKESIMKRIATMKPSPILTPSFRSRVGWYCLMCYLACLVPFTAVSRAAFLYHYMPALLYGEFLIGIYLTILLPPSVLPQVVVVMSSVVCGVFLYFSPWVYGLPLSSDEHAARRWLRSWN